MEPSKDCLVEHMKTVHDYRDIPCHKPDCGYIAFSQKNLGMHIKGFHGLGRKRCDVANHQIFRCPYPTCKSYFANEWNLQYHILGSAPTTYFECRVGSVSLKTLIFNVGSGRVGSVIWSVGGRKFFHRNFEKKWWKTIRGRPQLI